MLFMGKTIGFCCRTELLVAVTNIDIARKTSCSTKERCSNYGIVRMILSYINPV